MANDQTLLRLALAVVVLAHGIGHVLFLVPTVRLASWADQTGHSWLLTGSLGDGPTRAIAAVIWIAAIALFVAGVVGFLTGAGWWPAVTIVGAIVSIVGIVAMWDGLAQPSAMLALAFDVVVLVALAWAHWPATELGS